MQSVRGADICGAAAVRVDNHRLEGEKKTHLVVNLSSKAIGQVALVVNLQKDLHLPELLAPTGKSADIDLPLPQVTPARRGTGDRPARGLRPRKPARESRQNRRLANDFLPGSVRMTCNRRAPEKPGGVQPGLGVCLQRRSRPRSSLLAERRKPQVTVRQLLVVRIEDGVAKYQATFFYNVLYSGVKSLRIDIPEEVAKIAHTQTAHETIAPPPADLPKGYVAWRLSSDAELFGDGKIELVWENKIDKLDIGKSVNLPLPYLKPAEVDRAWGQIVLTKSETIDLREEEGEPKGLAADRSAAGFDGESRRGGPGVLLPRRLGDDRRRHALRSRRSQTHEHRARPGADGRHAGQRNFGAGAVPHPHGARPLAVNLPENVKFDTEPLRINGRSVMLEKQKGDYFIPIVAPNADTPFLLEMRYTLPENDGSRLDLPVFPQDPAVQKVFLAVYLPETKTLLNAEGPWTQGIPLAAQPDDDVASASRTADVGIAC